MRSAIAVTLAVAAAAVPAFSAPLPEGSYTYDLVARTPLMERDLVELLGRAQAADGQSGALGLGTLFKVGKGVVSGAEHVFGGNNNQQHRRDYDELQQRDELISMLLSRSAGQGDASGALGLGTLFKVGKGVVSGAEHLLGGNNNNNQKHRRDYDELQQRDELISMLVSRSAGQGDASGALGLGTLFKVGKGVVSGAEHLLGGNNNNNQQHRRDFDELQQRDELVSMLMSRAVQQGDASGALGLGTLFKVGKGVVSGAEHIFGGNNNNQQHRRELYDFEARDELEVREEPDTSPAL